MKAEITLEIKSAQDQAEVLQRYMPLVKATARRYEGRGAEYDDLVQEGCLALLRLAPMCKDRQWLAAYLKNRLPGCVRTAAARLRGLRPHDAVDLEEIEEIVRDETAPREYEETELNAAVKALLAPEEYALVRFLVDGGTQAAAARSLGVTQQAVAARLRRIRRLLLPLFADAPFAA